MLEKVKIIDEKLIESKKRIKEYKNINLELKMQIKSLKEKYETDFTIKNEEIIKLQEKSLKSDQHIGKFI